MQQAVLFRRERQVGEIYAGLLFCGLSAEICGICGRYIGVSFVERTWVLSCEYSPADSAEHAEEYSKAALFRRERQIGEVYAGLLFWGLSA